MTSNDDDYRLVADLEGFGYWPHHINGSTFSWTPELTGSAPVNFDDIRQSAPSFDVEDFDEAVFSSASEPSPRVGAYSHGLSLPSGYDGEDVYLSDHPSPGDFMGGLQGDTQLTAMGSSSHVLGDMLNGEPLISMTGISQMDLGFGGNGTFTISSND